MLYGLETEYGIAMLGDDPDDPLHPMYLSHHVQQAWLDHVAAGRGGWDFSTESPLTDMFGGRRQRGDAHQDLLTDVDRGLVNTMLTNGARWYVDHAHPEYATPEVTTAADAVLWDRAGEMIMARSAALAESRLGHPVRVYKNNTDGKGVSYGTHENYLLSRSVPFHRVVLQFTGFLVTRQIFTGAGRVGIGQAGQQSGFQLSQRADFFEREVGLETTMLRPIINTRDEPHADPAQWRRLHVITGDANPSQYATWLKVGTAGLVLRQLSAAGLGRARAEATALADPVAAMHAVSHDTSCHTVLPLAEGGSLRAVDLQEMWWEACHQLRQDRPEAWGDDRALAEADELLTAWADVLTELRSDPSSLADRVDWVAKHQLVESYRQRDGLDWLDPKLALIDLQYSDLDPRRSLHRKLVAAGRMRELFTVDEVTHAMSSPPTDTRAWLRGQVMEKFGDAVLAASWDSLVVELSTGQVRRVELTDPLAGTRDLSAELLEQCATMDELVARLSE